MGRGLARRQPDTRSQTQALPHAPSRSEPKENPRLQGETPVSVGLVAQKLFGCWNPEK